MFGYAQPTPWDVRFRLFQIPVRVHPLFWLIMALFGESVFRALGLPYLLLWVLCGFFSILLHELGHAIFIRRYGSPTAIVLTAFGGYAEVIYSPSSAWKRLIISAAGPGIQLLLVAVLYFTNLQTDWASQSNFTALLYSFLLMMNLFWAILNLMPIYPLDGGKIMREILVMLRFRQPDALTFLLSMITGVILALRGITGLLNIRLNIIDDVLPGWLRPGMFMTVWLIMFVVMNYQLWQQTQQRRRHFSGYDDDDSPPWRR